MTYSFLSKHTYFVLSLFFSAFFFITGCSSLSEAPLSSSIETEAFSPLAHHEVDYFVLHPFDFTQTTLEPGPFWSPILLPLTPRVKIELSSLLSGFIDAEKRTMTHPEENECISYLNQKESGQIVVQKSISSPDKELFFIYDDEKNSIIGSGILGSKQSVTCSIPHKDISILTGFGLQRNKEKMLAENSTFTLTPTPRGELYIDPSQKAKKSEPLYPGDILRIGRNNLNYRIQSIDTQAFHHEEMINFQIENDLFLTGDNNSKQIGAEDYLRTSFFITKAPYSLSLPVGDYIFTILRNGEPICLSKMSIKENQKSTLNCLKIDAKTENNSYLKLYRNTQSFFNFDATIYPKSLTNLKDFQETYLADTNNILLTEVNTTTNKNKAFSFLYKDKKEKQIQQHPVSLFFDEGHLLFLSGTENKNILHSIITNFSKADRSLFSLAGTGLFNFARGAVPFLAQTRLYNENVSPMMLTEHEMLISNGTIIEVIDPTPLDTDNRTVVPLNQQRVKIYLYVPAWNGTRYFDIYANGALYKRKVLSRGGLESTYSLVIEEKFKFTDNAYLSFIAWGDDFLPNYYSGVQKAHPIAATNVYCFQFSETQKCWH